jgi:hypothetical protein
MNAQYFLVAASAAYIVFATLADTDDPVDSDDAKNRRRSFAVVTAINLVMIIAMLVRNEPGDWIYHTMFAMILGGLAIGQSAGLPAQLARTGLYASGGALMLFGALLLMRFLFRAPSRVLG